MKHWLTNSMCQTRRDDIIFSVIPMPHFCIAAAAAAACETGVSPVPDLDKEVPWGVYCKATRPLPACCMQAKAQLQLGLVYIGPVHCSCSPCQQVPLHRRPLNRK